MRKFILMLMCLISLTSITAQTWHTIFFDDFDRFITGPLGSNYSTLSTPGITQLGLMNNEVMVASGSAAPSYWRISYVHDINYDNIRISCKFKSPSNGYAFAINARDNGVHTYSATVMATTDSIVIYRRDYSGNSTTLTAAKADIDINETYNLEFTLRSANLTFKFVEVGKTDTITVNATDNLLKGNSVNLSGYYYNSNQTVYFDDLRIESRSDLTGIHNIDTNRFSIFPNPASDMATLITNNYKYTDLSVRIYNAVGKLVHSDALNQNQQQINVSDLSNGIYMVEIKSKDWSEKQKLIIQR